MKENLTPDHVGIADGSDCDDKTAPLTAIKDLQAAGVDCDYDSCSNILFIDWDPVEAIAELLEKD